MVLKTITTITIHTLLVSKTVNTHYRYLNDIIKDDASPTLISTQGTSCFCFQLKIVLIVLKKVFQSIVLLGYLTIITDNSI